MDGPQCNGSSILFYICGIGLSVKAFAAYIRSDDVVCGCVSHQTSRNDLLARAATLETNLLRNMSPIIEINNYQIFIVTHTHTSRLHVRLP
eukprot:750572-Hanusia_phi.AAC.2